MIAVWIGIGLIAAGGAVIGYALAALIISLARDEDVLDHFYHQGRHHD